MKMTTKIIKNIVRCKIFALFQEVIQIKTSLMQGQGQAYPCLMYLQENPQMVKPMVAVVDLKLEQVGFFL